MWLLGEASTPGLSLSPTDLPTNLRLVSSWLQVVAAEADVTFAFQAGRKGRVPTTSDPYSGKHNFPETPSAPEALLARLGPVAAPSQKGSWETSKRTPGPWPDHGVLPGRGQSGRQPMESACTGRTDLDITLQWLTSVPKIYVISECDYSKIGLCRRS